MNSFVLHQVTNVAKPVLVDTPLHGNQLDPKLDFEEKTDVGPNWQSVIVIEDDHGSSEVENQGRVVGTERFQTQYFRGHSLNDSYCDLTSDLFDSSDEEECVVIESYQEVPDKPVLGGKKRPRSSAAEVYKFKKKRSGSTNVSDCEIIVDVDGKVRQLWEEAARRKRMANARHTAESEESTSVSDNAIDETSKGGDVPRRVWKSRKRASHHGQHGYGAMPVGDASTSEEKKEVQPPPDLDQQGSNVDVSTKASGDTTEEDTSTRDPTGCEAACTNQNLHPTNSRDNVEPLLAHVQDVKTPAKFGGVHKQDRVVDEPDVALYSIPNIVADRERLKQTEEFQHADEEEWTRRRLELQKQAEEAQRERKRRKLEAKRRVEMEVRQKQRLEEIRLRQMKEEQTSGFKEQIRGRVHAELERVTASCRDMSTVLKRLGVPIEGGCSPTTEQVLAAYKKALLRFHPDRASALAKNDLTHQVEAEEKFKLVSRMKGTLPLILTNHF